MRPQRIFVLEIDVKNKLIKKNLSSQFRVKKKRFATRC